jgi:hypothetical protein
VGAVEESDDLLGRAGFAQSREDPRDAVVVGVRVRVGHGVDGEGDVEPLLVRLAGGRLDPDAGGDARDDDLRDAPGLQVLRKARVGERAPLPLRHDVVVRLRVQGGDEISPSGGRLSTAARLFRPACWRTGDRDEHDRQPVPTEGVSERAGVRHDLVDGVDGGGSEDASLQIDDDEGGRRVKGGDGHGVLLLVMWTVTSPEGGVTQRFRWDVRA